MTRSSNKRVAGVNLSKERLELISDLLVEDISTIVREGVRGWLKERSAFLAQLLLQAEVKELTGRRYERNKQEGASRWGQQDGSVLLMEQRVPVSKPRVRVKGGGGEVKLETYEALNEKGFLNEQAVVKLLSGLSTRRFEPALEKALRGRGIGRQTISQRGIEEMTRQLEEFQTRSLEGAEILVVFMDGIGLADTTHVAAVGIDTEGKRHVLGFESGSTENHGVCRQLLSNLIDRGILNESGGMLFVVDGGKGLRKAITEVFGKRARVQRCMLHKRRNVEDKLPEKERQEFRHKYNAAYNEKSLGEAQNAFCELVRWLQRNRRTGAANSLLEGQQELLTLHRLGIGGRLRRSLCTTNCIESVFSAARYYTRNVKRWQSETQMERWLASGLLEAEKKLRKVPGYTQINKLKKVLAI